MKNILISPSILNADLSRIQQECVSLQNCGADWIHCDIMDGIFVPNTSFGVETVKQVAEVVTLPLDVHLMVKDPYNWVKDFVDAGAYIVTFHVEAESDVAETAKYIRSLGAKVGLSVKPATPVEALVPYADLFDMVLVMTVEPGFGGQKFIQSCEQKVRRARELFPDKWVEVDGGINAETGKCTVNAGADVLVAGSYIIKSGDRKKTIADMKKL